MSLKPQIYGSSSHDPWINLSLEEYWIEHVEADEIILFLWQNDQTVVIGRNQNAWKECRLEELENNGGKLARRLSGGGAVYHDLGNLNFSFIMQKSHYSLSRQLGVILQAIQALGLDPVFSGRNDILIDGKKFSGNSFYFDQHTALHHGTLLINTDMSKLGQYLNASPAKMSSKGIDSIQSRVINLSELDQTIDISRLSQNIKKQFINTYGSPASDLLLYADAYNLDRYILKHESWEWRYGKSPAFDMSYSRRFAWGEIEIGLELKKGFINMAAVYSDALEEDLIRQIQQNLLNCPYKPGELVLRIQAASVRPEHQDIITGICEWVKEGL